MRFFELGEQVMPAANVAGPASSLGRAQAGAAALSGSLSGTNAGVSPVEKQKQRTHVQDQIRQLEKQLADLRNQLASIK